MWTKIIDNRSYKNLFMCSAVDLVMAIMAAAAAKVNRHKSKVCNRFFCLLFIWKDKFVEKDYIFFTIYFLLLRQLHSKCNTVKKTN